MTDTLLTIRFAQLDDASAICNIYEDSWRLSYQGIIPHLALQKMINKRGPLWWRNRLKANRDTLILEFDGATIGYVTLGRNRLPDLPFAGEIQELYLLPTFQGLGFGKKLFLQARQMLARRGLTSVVVWALKDNDVACGFYARQGGRPVAKGREHFGTRRLEKVAFGWGED